MEDLKLSINAFVNLDKKNDRLLESNRKCANTVYEVKGDNQWVWVENERTEVHNYGNADGGINLWTWTATIMESDIRPFYLKFPDTKYGTPSILDFSQGGGGIVDHCRCFLTKTTSTTTIKLLLIVWCLGGRKNMSLHVIKFYFNTPMDRPKCMHILMKLIPQESFHWCNVLSKLWDIYIYINF